MLEILNTVYVGQNFQTSKYRNGLSCIVLEILDSSIWHVLWENGEHDYLMAKYNLIKPKFNSAKRECDTIVSWDSCAWKPKELL